MSFTTSSSSSAVSAAREMQLPKEICALIETFVPSRQICRLADMIRDELIAPEDELVVTYSDPDERFQLMIEFFAQDTQLYLEVDRTHLVPGDFRKVTRCIVHDWRNSHEGQRTECKVETSGEDWTYDDDYEVLCHPDPNCVNVHAMEVALCARKALPDLFAYVLDPREGDIAAALSTLRIVPDAPVAPAPVAPMRIPAPPTDTGF